MSGVRDECEDLTRRSGKTKKKTVDDSDKKFKGPQGE